MLLLKPKYAPLTHFHRIYRSLSHGKPTVVGLADAFKPIGARPRQPSHRLMPRREIGAWEA
jgi:hypothetical protein